MNSGTVGDQPFDAFSDVIFDAGGTPDDENLIELTLLANFQVNSVTVLSGTHVVAGARMSQTFTFGTTDGEVNLYGGTLEYVSTSNNTAPGLSFSNQILKGVNTRDDAGTDYSGSAKIILNFNGRASTRNGLIINNLFRGGTYNYDGRLELQGACFSIEGDTKGEGKATKGGEIIVDGGAQFQLGTIDSIGDASVTGQPESSMIVSPREYDGNVTLAGSTTGLSFESGTPGWVLKCGALRMVNGSSITGNLTLTNDANIVVYALSYNPGSSVIDMAAFASINGRIVGDEHNLTLTGAGTLRVGPGQVGQLIMEDVAGSGVVVSKNAQTGYYTNRASTARLGELEITSRATEKDPFAVAGYTSTIHDTGQYPYVTGSGWTKIHGSGTYVFQGSLGGTAASNGSDIGKLNVIVEGKDDSLVQQIRWLNLNVKTLRIKRGTIDLRWSYSGSGDVSGTNYGHYARNLEMSDQLDGKKVVSDLLVNAGISLHIDESLKMTGGRIVVKGQVNSTPSGAPDAPRTNEARLVLGQECDALGEEMNGVIELDEYSVLEVWGEDAGKRPKNGLNISVVHETAIARNLQGASTTTAFVLCENDRLNLNNNAASFTVRMKDGGKLFNASNFRSNITIQYSGGKNEDGKNVVYEMGGFGLNGSITLGVNDEEGTYKGLVQGDNYGVLNNLRKLEIRNEAILDFSEKTDMAKDSRPLFNFSSGSTGELDFGLSASGVSGSLTLDLGKDLLKDGQPVHYHLSNKKIAGWRQKIGLSFYDAVLRGVGLSFDESEGDAYGDGWLTVTGNVTPSNIYESKRDNNDNGSGVNWGWNSDGNPYESTAGARAVYVNKETNIDLRAGNRGGGEGLEYKRGLVIPNLVGSTEGNLVITGNGEATTPERRSLVTFSNRIDSSEMETVTEETGIKVNPDFYYSGAIDITNADLAIRHVEKSEPAGSKDDLEPAKGDSKTIITGSLKLAGGELLMQSGALDIRGKAQLGDGGILFANERTSQMQVSNGGSAEVGGVIQQDTEQEWSEEEKGTGLYTGEEHIRMSGGSKLVLRNNAKVKEGILIGNADSNILGWEGSEGGATPQTRDLAGTVSISGKQVSMEKGAQLSNVALNLQSGSTLNVDNGGSAEAREWALSGLSGEGKLVTGNGGEATKDLEFNLAGNSHTFTGDLAQYSGRMTFKDSKNYTQYFNGVAGGDNWDLTVAEGGNVEFNIASRENQLKMGDVELDAGSKSAFLLNLDPNLREGGEGFFFQSFSIDELGNDPEKNSKMEVGQDNGVAVLKVDPNDKNRVRQYIGHTDEERSEEYYRTSGVYFRDILNVKEGGRNGIEIDTKGDIYIVGELDPSNKYATLANSANSKAGAAIFDPIFSNPEGLVFTGDLGDVMSVLNDMLYVNIESGDKTAGDRLLASVAGASTSVLAPALGADMQRNLRSIRNRTTTMGMDERYEYDDLSHTSFWVNAETSFIKRDGEDLLPGYKSNAYGGTLGVAHNVSARSTVGLALSAMYQSVTSDAVDKLDADFTTAYISAFAVTQRRAWRHTFVASVGFTNAKMDRCVSWTDKRADGNDVAGSYSTSGSTSGLSFGLMYELGYAFAMNEEQSTVLQPVFNLQLHNAGLSSYEEEGSTAGLRVDPGEYTVLEMGLGARLQMVMGESVYNRASLLEMRALVKFYAGDEKGESSVGLLADTTGHSATVEGATEGRVGIEFGAGLSIPLENRAELFMDAGAEVRSSFVDFNATVGMKFTF